MFMKLQREKGQGLVEYALILVLVAIVVIAVLLQLGPEIRVAFGKVTAVLQGAGVVTNSGAITSVGNPVYTPAVPGVSPARIDVQVTVSSATTLTYSGDISGSQSCSGTCTITVTSPPASGQIIIRDAGGGEAVTRTWP